MSTCDWKINQNLMKNSDQYQEGFGIISSLWGKHKKKLKSRPTKIDEFMKDKGHIKMVKFNT